MKNVARLIAVCLLLIPTISISGPAIQAQDRDDAAPAARVVYHYVGRVTVNTATGKSEIVGYFTHIDPISGSLFNGAASENSAFFTFRAQVSGQPLTPNGDISLTLTSPGPFNVYFTANPNHSWSDLNSFSDGQVIATFERRLEQFSQIGPIFTNTASANLVSSADFTFGGEQFNFRNIAPHGITNATTGSSTALPGQRFSGSDSTIFRLWYRNRRQFFLEGAEFHCLPFIADG
jgi:hypothetical protein